MAQTVFFSYQDRDPEARRYAELIAADLRARGFVALLEPDKPSSGPDGYDGALYDALASSHAVVSILMPGSLDSPWIQFEARTAKLHRKWHPVVYGPIDMPESLANVARLDCKALDDADAGKELLTKLAREIAASRGHALVYRGRTQLAERGRWALFGSVFTFVAGLLSLLSNLGGVREAVCSNVYAEEMCTAAGWRTDPCAAEEQ